MAIYLISYQIDEAKRPEFNTYCQGCVDQIYVSDCCHAIQTDGSVNDISTEIQNIIGADGMFVLSLATQMPTVVHPLKAVRAWFRSKFQ